MSSNCKCKNCMNKRNKCEWFEVGTVIKRNEFGDIEETKTVATFETYEQALEYKSKLQIESNDYYFIDGWINKNNPEDVWNENE